MADLKVIGVGYCRTGTSSLKVALDRLGFRCYHMFEMFDRPLDASKWIHIYNNDKNRKHEFDKMFADYKATVDFPSVDFYRELIEYYPDAKVVLTLRDSNSWCNSYEDTILREITNVFCMIGQFLISPTYYMMIKKSNDLTFGTRRPDRQYLIEIFEKHNLDVLKYVPTERLLVYRVEQG